MTNLLSVIKEKKRQLDQYRPLPTALVKNLDSWFKVELTYTSNAIEGNTLSRAETALVVEKGLTVEGKTLREHLEAVNHAQALEWIKNLVNKNHQEISERNIFDLHQLILQKIDDPHAGRYRSVMVRIAGSTVIFPNYPQVPKLMSEFIDWLHQTKDDYLTMAALAHFKLVTIHPFVDGNGRTARILMNLLLLQSGYPPALIRKEDRRRYIDSIESGQLGRPLDDYYQLVWEAIDRSLDIYLEAIQEKAKNKRIETKSLLKIGELARLAKVTVPTIRYWTKEGLLPVRGQTPGGYQLYGKDSLAKVKKIRSLQNNQRLTLIEIKKILL